MSECTQCQVNKMKQLFTNKIIKNTNISIKNVIFAYQFIKVPLSNKQEIKYDIKLGSEEIKNQIKHLLENGFTD